GVPMSFMASDNTAWPVSLKIVGQGVWTVHAPPDVTMTMTSDRSVPLNTPTPWPPPGAAVSELGTTYTGDLRDRATSPQDAPKTTVRASGKKQKDFSNFMAQLLRMRGVMKIKSSLF